MQYKSDRGKPGEVVAQEVEEKDTTMDDWRGRVVRAGNCCTID
jgi:hypothetical protein